MKQISLFFGLLTSLSLHATTWGDMADNGVECSVVMEKTTFDPRASFPDFKLVFTNKGEKIVRLFDDFYPLQGKGPNISIHIWRGETGKKEQIAWYGAGYDLLRIAAQMNYITLKPGEKHEVCIQDPYLLLMYLHPLGNNTKYVLEVRFQDSYGEPGTRREYVGKENFSLEDRTPK